MGIIVNTIDACWRAFEVYPDLKNAFERKFQTDEELSALNLAGLGPGDIGSGAAVAVQQQPFNIQGRETQSLNYPIAIKLEIWMSDDQYRKTIDLLETMVKALFKARDQESGPTVMERATCGPPQIVQAFSVVFANVPQGSDASAQPLRVCYGSASVIFLAKIQVGG